MTTQKLLELIKEGCKYKYFSYDHKKALKEYQEVYNPGKYEMNPSCHYMPEELKEKHKVERIGKIRAIFFSPSGSVFRVKIGNKYPKSFYLDDFGKTVFPLKNITDEKIREETPLSTEGI